MVLMGTAIALAPAVVSPVSASAFGPLPACVYDDVLTPRREYKDWAKSLLDTRLKLGKRYAPPRLVPVTDSGIRGEGRVRPLVIDDLRALRLAARAADHPIEVVSAYRSFAKQKTVFEYWVDKFGYEAAIKTSARPGHSEHQLGTTLDFKAKGGRDPWLSDDWGATRTGTWMRKNAWKFGFVMSYPKGEKKHTCYSYEPWHFRYFGRDRAARIHESGLTTRQWLWRHGYGVGT